MTPDVPGAGRAAAAPHRLIVVGLDHYHVTGWVESLEAFADEIDIVGLYEPDDGVRASLAPRHVDPSLARALAPRYRDLPLASSLPELLAATTPDLALVTLPNRDAPRAIETLAMAGVHMLVDKPAAIGADEAERAFGAARTAGLRVSVGLARRVDPGWQGVERDVRAGRLGRLVAADAVTITSSVAVRDPTNPLFDPDRSGHGILHWLGIHDIDALLWVGGEPIVEVQGLTATVGDARVEVEDAASIAFRFAGGGMGTLHLVNTLPRPGYLGHVAFHGTRGSVWVDHGGGVRWFGPGDRDDPLRIERRSHEEAPVGGYGAGGLRLIRDWLDAIRDGREPIVSGDALVRALEVTDAAYRSAASGTREPVRRGPGIQAVGPASRP